MSLKAGRIMYGDDQYFTSDVNPWKALIKTPVANLPDIPSENSIFMAGESKENGICIPYRYI